MTKLRVGILGATGMVGQRFEIVTVAASERSTGKAYREAIKGRWTLGESIPANAADLVVRHALEIDTIVDEVDFVFNAVDIQLPTGSSDKERIRALEEAYAKRETPVISAASAHRWTPEVPMVIAEINPEHLDIIAA